MVAPTRNRDSSCITAALGWSTSRGWFALALVLLAALARHVAVFVPGVSSSSSNSGGDGGRTTTKNNNTLTTGAAEEDEGQDLATQALAFVMSRQAAFQEAGMETSWKFRGVGYLYSRHDVILAATVVLEEQKQQKSVHIYNVHPSASHLHQGQARDDCDKFTIWVRVYGPEIFAGSAQTVDAQGSRDCSWKFDFEPTLPGEYAVDAKSMLWNGKHRHYGTEQKCWTWEQEGNMTTKRKMETQYPKHSGFRGFKFYDPQFVCCEICNRLAPYCQMWATPPWKIDKPRKGENGCELFFGADTPDEYIPKSWMLGDINVSFPEIAVENISRKDALPHIRRAQEFQQMQREQPQQRRRLVELSHGQPHGGEPQYFIGCGWSSWFTLDFPCLSGALDDMVFLLNDKIHLSVDDLAEQQQLERRDTETERPLCRPEIELTGHSNGRWVQEEWPSTCPPFRIDSNVSQKFDIVAHDGDNPHCWHRDDLSHIGELCIEMNCRSINPLSIWNSRARVDKWFGVWRERSCDYVEFTDDELQQCIDTKKIKSFATEGKSISSYLKQYLMQRVSGLQLYKTRDDTDAIGVVLSTVGLVHFSVFTDTEVWNYLQKRYRPASRNRRVFVVNGFYLSSERTVFTHVEHMSDLNQRIVEGKLLPNLGYELLNVFDLSAAFTYDTATQRDGMHIIGPPMKMVITKMFHYLCHDVVSGSRV